MKQFLTTAMFFCVLVFSACTELDFHSEAQPQLVAISKHFNVTLNDAKVYAEIVSKSNNCQISQIEPIVHERDTLAYIINYTQGWELVSGDKRTPVVLAYDEKGALTTSTANQGVLAWMDDMLGQIYMMRYFGKEDRSSNNYQYWMNLTDDREPSIFKSTTIQNEKSTHLEKSAIIELDHLIETNWGQSEPFNKCVPYKRDYSERCPVGCVAVAGAQMLYYLHYKLGVPSAMFSEGSCTGWADGNSYSYSFSFSNSNTSVWDEMGKYFWDSPASTYKSAILMGRVGQLVGMKYDDDGSSASTSDLVSDVFNTHGISCSYEDYDIYSILSNLNAHLPVIIRADGTKKKFLFIPYYRDGHSWIIDGYSINGSLTYWRMNWGWSGSYDSGLFLSTASGDNDWEIDMGSEHIYHFVHNRKIITGFSN